MNKDSRRATVLTVLIGFVALPLGAALGWLLDRVVHGPRRRRAVGR